MIGVLGFVPNPNGNDRWATKQTHAISKIATGGCSRMNSFGPTHFNIWPEPIPQVRLSMHKSDQQIRGNTSLSHIINSTEKFPKFEFFSQKKKKKNKPNIINF